MLTVTVPPEASVTLPANTLPLRLKLAVLALPLTALVIPASVAVTCAGIASLRLPVNVLGPALLTTSVKLVVRPTATVLDPTTLLGLRFTTLLTVPGTCAVVAPLFVVPAGTTNNGATTAQVPGTVSSVVNLSPSKVVGSSTVAVGLTTSFTLVVSNAGPSTFTGSLSDAIPAQVTATLAGITSAVNGSASTANFSLSGSVFAGSVTLASGGTVTVSIVVTGVSAGNYTNTLAVLVPAGTSTASVFV